MDLALIRYDDVTEDSFVDYISEWEFNDEKVIPSALRRDGRPFSAMLKKWREDEKGIPKSNEFVPATLYFLIDKSGRILGGIHFRHYLNDRLRHCGGHLGYGIRKSERKKGYAHEMLKLLLEELKRLDLDKLLITCDDDNIGSSKTIESCNGILQNKVIVENKLTRRYWINLKC